ncbi:exodeoxyribonuclease V subunit gamma [Thauera aromatica]|uniref:exodeoxyribonuclease V subunit gamma n=1 Tax=Thauera aromatica TaxID=59405 RepID=UPI001FFC83E5|nr:exodeoxyribonuclease V subunit gamma [Thauera aromatica]
MTYDTLPPGFIALHGNRIETLLDTVAAWMARHPLTPLEPEIVLVQSNGMAEWVKMALARQAGVCAATAVQLPGRFLWQTYRQVLGRGEVPARSPLDKTTLAWRLMRLLPDVVAEAGFEPIAGYLGGNRTHDDAGRRFQLALRIADLYDQYQVHRSDWLDAWGEGRELMCNAEGVETAPPPDQRWQARLWQRVLEALTPAQRALTRPQLHERVLTRLEAMGGQGGVPPDIHLPRRVVLFGMTHVPLPTLQLLAALSRHTQVLLAIPNPCRFHWADIMDGREWLRIARRRQPLRNGRDLHSEALDAMHLHAHPLLAAWGRQARDFVRQLDAFDDAEATRERFPLSRLDLFDEDTPADASLLEQAQHHIRDLRPLAEHPKPTIPTKDRSIVFHLAHSPVRELEILHDQLLKLLAEPPGGKPLRPRDIVVMVPAIDDFAPAIRAVFGQYGRHDPRHIPFDIADLSARASSPLMTAIEWLLRIPHDRCRLSDLTALLDVPAIAARFGIAEDALPRLTQWISGAGIRWGLDATHREGLGLGACGAQNTALFGLQRMLMGYAVGDTHRALEQPYADIEPYDEIGGLDAELAGAFAQLIERLLAWQSDSCRVATPEQWAERLRALLADLVHATDDGDRQTLGALHDALEAWLDACDEAEFDAPLPLEVAAEALLDALEWPALGKRFRAGGITFCTLMPMRAIPFEVVCLLGMNDGDYPRRSPRSDFDLMALPGQQRPGDRARRDDDRQLMLEALLSARRVLYVSWCGHSVRDNTEQPPSVLVAQLRDYLAAGWSPETVAERTTQHPLQPFSRRYFEPDSGLATYAREWRAAHVAVPGEEGAMHVAGTQPEIPPLAPFIPDPAVPLTIAELARFLRNPVKAFFRQRLGVIFDDPAEALPDAEVFGFDKLEEHGLVEELAKAVVARMETWAPQALAHFALEPAIEQALARIGRAGRLPMAGVGARIRATLGAAVLQLLHAWQQARTAHPVAVQRLPLRHTHRGVVLEDWLGQRFATTPDTGATLWIELNPGRLLEGTRQDKVRAHKLLYAWVKCLLAAASEASDAGLLIGRDATLRIETMAPEAARATLATLLEAWQQGLSAPLPVALKTALAFVAERNAADAYEGNERSTGEGEEATLARCYPDFESLIADGQFESLARTLYAPLADWVGTHIEIIPHPEPTPAANQEALA